jgi:dephospho-CoA kinase|tara:strand:- start:1538 stop:2104 length:567 start_codon:yes stop_codon:yes gene_type:complete
MIRIGITGSIASGKSTVAQILSKKKYPLFSADLVVKKLYRNKTFIKKLKKVFNLKNKSHIKQSIKETIIKSKINLGKIERIIHPLVRKEMIKFSKAHKQRKFLLFEIPLLFENRLSKFFNFIIFVHAKKRLRKMRYLSKFKNEKIFTILDSKQMNPLKKMKKSNHIIINNKTLRHLKNNVNIILGKYE